MNFLIIGKDSYIGNHIDWWLTQHGHLVQQLDVLTEAWKTFDYSPFDAVIHVAGIVHQPKCHDWDLYKRVNVDMPIAIARMAKAQGVRQYVYLSTMAVFGIGKELHPNIIDENTLIAPTTMYGKSKWMAESELVRLQDNSFNVACVRPPNVFGRGCKGNYITGFTKLVRLLPVIPQCYENVRQSFIYIDNLAELIRIIVINNLCGTFCPQDRNSVSANELMDAMALALGLNKKKSNILGLLVSWLAFMPIVNKIYGGVEYAKSLAGIPEKDYVVVSVDEAIKRTLSKE